MGRCMILGDADVVLTVVGDNLSNTAGSSFETTGLNLGDEAADRYFAVGMSVRDGSGSNSIDSVVLAGVPLTDVYQQGTTVIISGFFIGLVPLGTTNQTLT